jgi:hypothetical protein
MSDNNVVEMIEGLKKEIDNEKAVAQILADSADEIVKAQTEKFETLNKSFESLVEKVEALAKRFDEINIPNIEDIEKSINDKVEAAKADVDSKIEELEKSTTAKVETIEKSVESLENEPVKKSVSYVEPVEAKAEEVKVEAAPTVGDLISKALNELPKADPTRAKELSKAISQLNSGVNPANVKF